MVRGDVSSVVVFLLFFFLFVDWLCVPHYSFLIFLLNFFFFFNIHPLSFFLFFSQTSDLAGVEKVIGASFGAESIEAIGMNTWHSAVTWWDELFVGKDKMMGFRCPRTVREVSLLFFQSFVFAVSSLLYHKNIFIYFPI